jgi:DNA-binding NarL/FixJ family response regulator
VKTRKPLTGERNGVQQVTLVDDDAGGRESLRLLFRRDERFAVLSEHARAKDALKQLTNMPPNQHPHLVLLDISMPGMDGIECCAGLRERFPDLKIAMFTASSVRNCFEPARLAGADAYIVKGAGRNALIEPLLQLNRCAGQCLCVAETGLLWPAGHARPKLTARETEVLDYVGRGGIYKQAAEHFYCSESNIKKTMARAISHLNARSKDHAIRL